MDSQVIPKLVNSLFHGVTGCETVQVRRYAARGAKRQMEHGETIIYNAFGYSVLDLSFTVPEHRRRVSYIKARYDWGRAYGKQPSAAGAG